MKDDKRNITFIGDTTYHNVVVGVFKGELASKIVSNFKSENINNVDKRSTLKPEDYPVVLDCREGQRS
jgi:hypothetical protein